MTDLDLTLPTPGVTKDWGDIINTALEALQGEINGRLGESQLAGTYAHLDGGVLVIDGAPVGGGVTSGGAAVPAGARVPLLNGDPSSSVTLQPGWINLMPVFIPTEVNITEVSIEVKSAAPASSTLVLGVYALPEGDSVGDDGVLVADFGEIATDSTGVKVLTGSWTIPAGVVYVAAMLSAGTSPGLVAYNRTYAAFSVPVAVDGEYWATSRRYLDTGSGSSLPATTDGLAGNAGSQFLAVSMVVAP